MDVLSVASEAYPLVKTGGLADVAGALPAALRGEGVRMRTLLPGYLAVTEALDAAETLFRWDDLFGGAAHLLAATSRGLDLFVLDAPHLFARPGNPYLGPDGRDWPDNALRFAALARVGAWLARGLLPSWRPACVHAHDWQAALLAAYLHYDGGAHPGSVLTVHNLAFQGVFPPSLLPALGLPPESFALVGVEYFGSIGFLKAGLLFADRITTVSPTYAAEIRTPADGMALDGLLRGRGAAVSGILNGIDTEVWNPATDRLLPAQYDAARLAARARNRSELQFRFSLAEDASAPLFGVVSRLTGQKGMDLLLAALPVLLAEGGQLAVLGAGDAAIERGFRDAAAAHPGRVGCVVGYDEALAHLVQGGADALLVPSRFEPCGLTQLCALRYGAIPVVARVGGLADTVIDASPMALAAGVATGVQFAPVTVEMLEAAICRAAALHRAPPDVAAHAAERHGSRRVVARPGTALCGVVSRTGGLNDMQVTEGAAEPLGATPDAAGTNFAVMSAHATAIEVCLFDAAGERETARVALAGRSGDVWHGHIAGVAEGARYGLRAHGPYAPQDGHRFNPHKLLLDPYATSIDRKLRLDPTMFADNRETDSAAPMAKAIVGASDAALRAATPLVPWERTVLYELQVRGFSMRHPEIPEALRGTFAALAHPAAIAHLTGLGITSVELMPSAAWIEERHLATLGLRNAWGYNPVGFLAPDPLLAPGGWAEVRAAVAALAAAGIETILDVVLNHSGEGDELGPTLSLRGLDNATYYRLRDDRRLYVDDTGCGNTLALDRPAVLRLAMDALRGWARRAGVHGFRFDLATTLGRRDGGFDAAAPLLAAIAQDPELRALKLIAEPWDPGADGYQVGKFPAAWGEWNDHFRDGVRRFWRGDARLAGELATRLAGSADLFAAKRRPSRSVNFVVAHDGFTLADLVSYAAKHNDANGEGNHDGSDQNFSWNHGVEGPSDAAAVLAARLADQRALLATLLLARGTPMLAMGSELGRSQGGNNNAYAQDNATSWLDWAAAEKGLAAFVARLTALRRDHPALRRDRFLSGTVADETLLPDVAWLATDGAAMRDWDGAATLVVVFSVASDRVALVCHRGAVPVPVTLPAPRDGYAWEIAIDSSTDTPPRRLDGAALTCPARALLAVVEATVPQWRRSAVDASVLDRLASAAGIAPDWWDIDGTRHRVSPDTQRALLAAMQLPAGSTAEARDSLHRFAEAQQRRALPHALVVREGTAPVLTLAAEPGRHVVLEGEDGAQESVALAAEAAGEVSCVDGRSAPTWRATLPVLPVGRWRVWRDGAPEMSCALTVAPAACYLPPPLRDGGRRFGLAAHLYSVRRAGDQGIGDFTSLALLAGAAARAGAAVVGLNPLHALFPDRRDRASPYHPSDRRFLDPIYIDVTGEEAGLDAPAARAAVAHHAAAFADLAAAKLVDYPAVWAAKRTVLEAAFAAFDRDQEMAEFRAYGGAALQRFATFQAIAEQRAGEDWRRWPEALRDPERATADPARVRFHTWLQYLADRQLGAAAAGSGLAIGLYRDLAVGTAPDGAEAWAGARQLAAGRLGRRAARPVLDRRADLAPAAVRPVAPARRGLSQPRRRARRQHAPRRRAAHRPRDGAGAAVLGARRRQRGRRRLCRLSARRPARRAGAGEPAGALPDHRRGPGHRARRVSPGAGGGRGAELPRAVVRARRRPLPAARQLPGAGGRLRFHPRPADARRLARGRRHRRTRGPRPDRREGCADGAAGRDRGADAGHRRAARRARGPWLPRRLAVRAGAGAARRPQRRARGAQPARHRPGAAELAAQAGAARARPAGTAAGPRHPGPAADGARRVAAAVAICDDC